MNPPRPPQLHVDVALTACDCSHPGCIRIIQPGETLYMRDESPRSQGPKVCYPLCVVCGTAAHEDDRLQVRVWLHGERQRRLEAMAAPLQPPQDPRPSRL